MYSCTWRFSVNSEWSSDGTVSDRMRLRSSCSSTYHSLSCCTFGPHVRSLQNISESGHSC
jgi:hypothetical protein